MESYGYNTKDVVYEENTDKDAFLYSEYCQHLEWVYNMIYIFDSNFVWRMQLMIIFGRVCREFLTLNAN